MEIEVYIPVLFKFSDDKIVFEDNELEEIENEISQYFKKIRPARSKKHDFPYTFKDNDLLALEEVFKSEIKDIMQISVEFYYYHHRSIFKYTIKVKQHNSQIREIRKLINENYNNILTSYIVNKINELVDRRKVREEGRVITYYSYMLIFCPQNKYHFNKVTDRVQTLTFKIIESSKNVFQYGKSHYVRISIPGIIVYYSSKIGLDMKMDLINAIYQHCLYSKKIDDCSDEEYRSISEFTEENLLKYNKIDEKHLTLLWTYAVETLGGKITDNQIHDISKENFYLAFLAFVLSIISIILSIVEFTELF